MKKLVLLFAVVLSASMFSCNNSAETTVGNEDTTVNVTNDDVVDADSLKADSTDVDSLKAAAADSSHTAVPAAE